MPTSQLSVGTLQDWMAFWGSYLGATISALVAFIILGIQRKDHQQEVSQARFENQIQYAKDRHKHLNDNLRIIKEIQQEYAKTRGALSNLLAHQQEVQWLGDLRKTLANYISAYGENEEKDIINSIQSSSFESIQQKIKEICSTLSIAHTAFSLVISENSKTTIGDTKRNWQKCTADICQ